MESPAPEEMPLVLAYPADGGPREQSPNVVLRALPPSVAVNMSTILVGARVIDWPALMRQLQDEASLQGWTLASKVQKRPSEHPGWGGPCYCTKQGCSWRVVLSKERDSSASTISSANMEHNHSLEQKTQLPASHTWRNETKVRKSMESHMTHEELRPCSSCSSGGS